MKIVRNFEALAEYGIEPTGTLCGAVSTVECLLTSAGQKLIEGCLNCTLTPKSRGHILLPREMFKALAVLALLQDGYEEVLTFRDHPEVVGLEAGEGDRRAEWCDGRRVVAYGCRVRHPNGAFA